MEIFYLLGLILFLAISYKRLSLGVVLISGLLPSYLLRFEVLGIPFTFLEVMVLSLVGMWLFQERARWRSLFVISKNLQILGGLFVLALGLSLIVSPDTLSGLGVLRAYFIEPVLLFFVVKDVGSRNKDLFRMVFRAFAVLSMFLACVGIFQFLTGRGIPIPWDIERRVTSVFHFPNAVGLLLGPLAAGFLPLIFSSKVSFDRYLFVGGFVAALVSILLAQSEAALVSLVVTFLVYVWYSSKKYGAVFLVVILLIVGGLFATQNSFSQKLLLQDASGQVRISQWIETSDMLKSNSIFGAGLSGYPIVFKPYHQLSHLEIFQYPHNHILNTYVEIGILGLLVSVYFFYLIGKTLIVGVKNKEEVSIIISLIFLQMLIHGFVDVPYFKNDLSLLVWILIGFIYATGPRNNQSSR